MRRVLIALAAGAALTLMSASAEAHGPSRKKVTQEITFAATPDEVWAAIGRFDDLSWDPAVKAVEIVDGAEIKPGTKRIVTWANGETTTEQLTKWKPEERLYGFRTLEDNIEALPVTNYTAILTVEDAGGKAAFTWDAGFYRGFPNNDPPPELDDDAAIAAVTAAQQAGIDALLGRFGAAE
jgi:hypothetical protein